MLIGADAELALYWEKISPVPKLNIHCPKFYVILIPLDMRNNLKPFAIVLFMKGLDKKTVAEEHSWYNYNFIAASLFEEGMPQMVQMTLGNTLTLFSVKLRKLKYSERKRYPPTPLISNIPAIMPAKPKKKKTLKMLANVVPPPHPTTTAPTYVSFAPLLSYMATKK